MRKQFPALPPFMVGVEDEAALVEGLEQHHPYRRLPAFLHSAERHRVGLTDDRAIDFFGQGVHATKSLDRIRWNQLIPRHRRVDFIDPAKYAAREIPDISKASISKLLRRVHAASAELAIEDGLSILFEPGDLGGNVAE